MNPRSRAAEQPQAQEQLFRSVASILRKKGEADRQTPEGDPYRLERGLIEQYKGKRLEDLYDTCVEQTPVGECLHLVDRLSPFSFNFPDPAIAGMSILSELRLVHGVGPITLEKLRGKGVESVHGLLGHKVFGQEAARIVGHWERRDLIVLHERMRKRLGGEGHSLGLLLASVVPQSGFLVLDLETLGLSGAPVFLYGIARCVGDSLEIHQYLAREGGEEPAALMSALAHLQEAIALITYNGRTADVPWLRQRSAFFGMGPLQEKLHLDLIYPTRFRYRTTGPPGEPMFDHKLSTVEKELLGVDRTDDVPGYLVPYFYKRYETLHNVGPLVPIIDHNRADLVSTARLLSFLGSVRSDS